MLRRAGDRGGRRLYSATGTPSKADGEDAARPDGSLVGGEGGRGESSPAPRPRARGLTIRRQSVLYTILVGLGSALNYLSGLRDLPLITEGTAFMAMGAVGLIMSWTTQGIGQSIKDAVREDGELTRTALREGLRELVEAVKGSRPA